MNEIRNILTVGAGAVGAYFTGRLAQHGANVSVVVRSDYDAVRQNGFHLQSEFGDFEFHPNGVYRTAEECPETPDLVVLTSKVLPEADPVRLLKGAVRSPDTIILLIQNGIGIEDRIAKAFPQNEILSTIAYIGATRTAPGMVTQKGAAELKFGRFGGGVSEKGTALAEQFRAAGVKAECVADIQYFRWVKLLWNVPFNTVSVVGGGLNTREMMDRGPIETLCREMMEEVRATARACGVDLPEKLIDDNMTFTRNFPPYKTSMLVDFEAGRPVEADAIVGNVCRYADAHGIPVPRIRTCYTLLTALNERNVSGKA